MRDFRDYRPDLARLVGGDAVGGVAVAEARFP
jgi:hypothetical protein